MASGCHSCINPSRVPVGTWLRGTLALLAWSAGATAQPARTGAVAGYVADSLARRMLADATVEIVGTDLQTRTDRDGRFAIGGIPAGTHALRFVHPALDALGDLSVPDRTVTVSPDDTTFTPLAIPSATTLYRALCGSEPVEQTGVLVGTVRNATTDVPIADVEVVIAWSELRVQRGRNESITKSVRATTAPSGQYKLCGVPTDIELAAQLSLARERFGVGELALHGEPFATADLPIVPANTPATAPSARISGVVTARGTPVSEAAVFILGLEHLTTTDSAGRFLLAEVPGGRQRVELRRVGFAPAAFVVTVRPGQSIEQRIEMEPVQLLAARTVEETPIAIWDSVGFEERRRRGSGTFLESKELEKSAIDFTSALRSFSGFAARGNPLRTGAVDAPDRGGCTPTFFVDGVMIESRGNATGAPVWLRPEQIRAMEIYRNRGSIPPRFARLETCGAVVVWTRNRYLEEESYRKRAAQPARPARPPR